MSVSGTELPSDQPFDEARHLQYLQRMAMLGTLAGGLGHDLRNLVMPVLLRLDALEAAGDLSERARRDLGGIRQSMTHLQRLAGGLRLLASDPFEQRDEAHYTTLREWWQDLAPVVQDALPVHAVLDAEFAAELPPVSVPPAVLAQVLINLVLNARRAMDDAPVPSLVLRARIADGGVRLDVTDNGRGMDPETRRRCFEPYFTTRPREIATGLGLSMGRALMQRSGGDLLVADSSDHGTTFTIVLPIRRRSTSPSVSREVRLLVREPRQLAIVRLLVSQWGFSELSPEGPGDPELIICDAESLAGLMEEGHAAPAGTRPSRIIAIGKGDPGVPDVPDVQWIDPGGLAKLGAMLP